MDQFLQKFIGRFTKTAIGLSVYVSDSVVQYFVLLLRRSGTGDLEVIAYDEFDDLKALTGWIEENGKHAPVMVALDGKHTLIKQLDSPVKVTPDVLVKQLVPGGDSSQLLINAYSFDQSAIASLMRKEKYLQNLEPLQQAGINLYDCFIGPGVTLRYRAALLGEEGTADHQYGFYQVNSADNQSMKMRRAFPSDYAAISADLNIPHHYLSAYCLATTYFVGDDPQLINQCGESFIQSGEEYIHKRLFRPYFTVAAVTLLAVFMLNVYFYMESARENGVLTEESASTRLLVDQYNKVRQRFEEKQKIVDRLNYSNIESAWISDQIGSLVPKDVSLSSFRINPPSKNSKDKSPFVQQSIVVEGISGSDRSFGEFVSAMSALDFVDEIDYQHYKFNQSLKKGEFEVKLTYQTD